MAGERSGPMDNLGEIIERVRAQLSEKHGAREEGLRLSRDAIRHCASSIRATHRGEFEEAEGLLGKARELLDEAEESLQGHPSMYHAGFFMMPKRSTRRDNLPWRWLRSGGCRILTS